MKNKISALRISALTMLALISSYLAFINFEQQEKLLADKAILVFSKEDSFEVRTGVEIIQGIDLNHQELTSLSLLLIRILLFISFLIGLLVILSIKLKGEQKKSSHNCLKNIEPSILFRKSSLVTILILLLFISVCEIKVNQRIQERLHLKHRYSLAIQSGKFDHRPSQSIRNEFKAMYGIDESNLKGLALEFSLILFVVSSLTIICIVSGRLKDA